MITYSRRLATVLALLLGNLTCSLAAQDLPDSPTADGLIRAAIADLPPSGGDIDARHLDGPQSWEACPFAGMTKRAKVFLGSGTTSLTADCTVPRNITLVFSTGSSIDIARTKKLNINGTIEAPMTQIFAGAGSVRFGSEITKDYPEWWGCVPNGTDDCAPAILAAIDAFAATGGTVQLVSGTYRIRETIWAHQSNVIIDGNGAEILYEPSTWGPGNDRAIAVHTDDRNLLGPFDVTGPIAAGATAFTAIVPGLTAGDWLFMYETDAGAGDIVIADWLQVSAISGATISTYKPFRQSFTDTRMGTKFFKIRDLVQNVTVRNLRCRTTDADNPTPCFVVGIAKGVTFDNVEAAPRHGNPFYTHRANGVVFRNSRVLQIGPQASEFASTSDLVIDGNTFITAGASPVTASLVLDFGTSFFTVANNQLASSANIGLALFYGVYYGSVSNNVISFVRNGGLTDTIGMSGLGAQHVAINGNTFSGGAGRASTGIALGDTSGFTRDVQTRGNFVGANVVSGFVYPYYFSAFGVAPNPRDAFMTANETEGYIRFPGKVELGESNATNSTEQTLLSIRSSRMTDLPIRWTHTGIHNWFAGPNAADSSKWCVNFNEAANDTLCLDSRGNLNAKGGLRGTTFDGTTITASSMIRAPQIWSTGAPPTIEAGPAACESPALSVSGNDVAGTITIKTGTSCPAALARIALFKFAKAYPKAPTVTFSPVNAAAATIPTPIWMNRATADGVSFEIVGGRYALAGGTTYQWDYQVIQ
jgi:hypothetical protein